MNDKDIIALYFDRAENAIAQTEERYGKRCFMLAKGILGNEEDAKECVNDALFALWNKIPPEEPAYLGAYLLKITRHIALDRFDHNTAACRNGELSLVLDELAEILPDEGGEITEEGEIMRALNAFLETEKRENRIPFVRRYFYHESMREIADRCHMSENAVRASLFRTRKKLAIYLKKQGLGGDYVK